MFIRFVAGTLAPRKEMQYNIVSVKANDDEQEE
jgi:hypothetical protein